MKNYWMIHLILIYNKYSYVDSYRFLIVFVAHSFFANFKLEKAELFYIFQYQGGSVEQI